MKTSDHDSINCVALSYFSVAIYDFSQTAFNKNVEASIFREFLKLENICSLHIVAKHDYNNYRPINFLSLRIKSYEKRIQLLNFCCKYNLIYAK